jgi:hypothetical protein
MGRRLSVGGAFSDWFTKAGGWAMTTSSKIRPELDAPAVVPRYEDDLYGWVQHQVALLKAGRLTEVDAGNIAEELSDVGGEQYDKLESALRVVMLHLLKWDHQPTHRSRSWVLSVREHRRRIERILRKNPSLRPQIEEARLEGYIDAQDDAVRETGFPETQFPDECPYDWDAIMNRVVALDELVSPRKR